MKNIVISAALSAALAIGANAGDLDLMVGKNFFDSDANLDDALSYGLRYNHYYQDSPWGTQIGFDKIDGADIDIAGVNGDINANRVFLNALYEISSSESLKTFLLGGVGYEDINNDDFGSLGNNLFLDAGVAARYKINETLSFIAEAKYLRKLEDHMNDFTVSIGLGFSFGEGAVKPAPKMEPKKIEKPKPVAKPVPAPKPKPKPEPKPVKQMPKDSDKDGVYDKFDRCPDTYAGTKVDHEGCPIMMELHINFDTDKSFVKPVYDNQIEKAVNAMRVMPWVDAKVVGHTDSRASDAYNQKLSQRRAEAVKQKMIQIGEIKPSRITAIGKGEKEPIATNDTEEGMAENRRVEVLFTK